LHALRPALADTHTLLLTATPLLQKLRPTVHSLAAAASVGVPVIRQLKPALDNLAAKVLPGLAERYAEEGGRPVYDMVGPTFIGLGVLASFFDQDGEFANLTAGLGAAQSQQVLPCTLDFSGKDFLVCNTLSQALQQFFSGGTGLLQGLVKRPGGQGIFGSLLAGAQRAQSQLNATAQTLAKQYPLTAKFLLAPHHGGLK
jgi:hypothetical protein